MIWKSPNKIRKSKLGHLKALCGHLRNFEFWKSRKWGQIAKLGKNITLVGNAKLTHLRIFVGWNMNFGFGKVLRGPESPFQVFYKKILKGCFKPFTNFVWMDFKLSS